MVDHFADGGVIQHHVGNCNFDIDHQAVYLVMIPQFHRTDQDIAAVFQAFSEIFLIFPEIRGDFCLFQICF